MKVPVVENPRRSRRRRSYSAKQRAAGFGGKRSMRRPQARSRSRSRRRNPALATLSNPRTRRRRSYTTYKTYRRHYSYKRRRNPFLGGLTSMLDLSTAASVAGGIVVSRLTPGLIAKVWPGVPRVGLPGMAVRLGGVLMVAFGMRSLLGARYNRVTAGIVAGGIGYMLYELADQYLLPAVGLSGIGYNSYVTEGDLRGMGLSGYRVPNARLSGYQPGQRMVDEVLQA